MGAEEEFFVVSAQTGSIVGAAEAVLQAAGDAADAELLPEQVESNSNAFTALDELEKDLRRRRTELAEAARQRGLLLAASATAWQQPDGKGQVTPRRRYRQMADRFGPIATDQLVNGCHVHVAVPSRELGVAVVGRLGPWLSPLLAVSANSPFWIGADTGYASYRSQVWRRWPATTTAVPFGSAADYEANAAALIAIGAALDEGMLYFSARPSEQYPTVELRVADVCLTAADAVMLAALSRALVMRCLEDELAGLPRPSVRPEILQACEWRAARYGLDGLLVLPESISAGLPPRLAPAKDVLRLLVDRLSPHLDAAGDLHRVTAGLARLFAEGTGAFRQRQAWSSQGRLDAVTDFVLAQTLTG